MEQEGGLFGLSQAGGISGMGSGRAPLPGNCGGSSTSGSIGLPGVPPNVAMGSPSLGAGAGLVKPIY